MQDLTLQDQLSLQEQQFKSTQDFEMLEKTIEKVKRWISTTRGLKFFTPLVLAIPTEFKDLEYMLGRFGSDGIVIMDTNRIFLGVQFTLNLTLLQQSYFLLNALLQITHLYAFRMPKLIAADTHACSTEVKEACAGLAAMLVTNNELYNFLPNYYKVLKGTQHFMATVTVDNYWQFLGWESLEDVPSAIADVQPLLNDTVERLAILFIKHHNPQNPPKMPQPLWGQGSPDEKGDRAEQVFKNEAKMLTRRAVQAAESARHKNSSSDVFCPFNLDDLHLMETTPLSYKDVIDKMVVQSLDDWGGFDRRNLGTGIDISYNYTLDSENVTCVVYCDTSGSLVSDIKKVLSEVVAIAGSSYNAKVLVKYFSSDVQKLNEDEESNFISADTAIADWNLPKTTGGTEFAPLKADIEENYSNHNVVIITDGYFCDDVTPISTSGKLLFVMTQNYNTQINWDELGLLAFSDI